MKKFNLAALPVAVAGVLASTSAFAGTEACFEVYTGADNFVVSAFATKYTPASCVAQADRVAAAADDLAPTSEVAIAYELTGDLDVELDDIDATGAATGEDQHIVYIPTTDIPGGTKITMELTGATFNGNSDQIHLVKYDEVAADGSFEAVASSDGTVDGTGNVVFLTKAGVTIGAGTRLAFSRVSTGASGAIVPVGFNVTNTTCTTASSTLAVNLRATSAKTDGGTGYDIEGGVSSNQSIADISAQFYALQEGTTAEVNVNAESSDSENVAIVARTEFVYDAGDVTNQLVAKQYEAVYKTAFYNRGPVLDQAVTLSADDHLETKFVNGADAGTDVEMGLWNARTAATGVLGTQEVVETGTTWGLFGLTEAAAVQYDTETAGATGVFTEEDGGLDAETNPHVAADDALTGADYNEMYYVVTNRDPAAIMNFNYEVDTHYTLNFDDADYLDHCAQEKNTHDIGVNGAVLKVPYITTASGNFVRVTNEHDEAAEVTFDMFGESVDGNVENRKVTAVALGTVPAKSSVVYMMTDVLAEAQAAGYLGADGGYDSGDLGSNFKSSDSRHTVTFTVTAPRDSVHGVAVQKVIGSVADRVMPVLDQNDWSQ